MLQPGPLSATFQGTQTDLRRSAIASTLKRRPALDRPYDAVSGMRLRSGVGVAWHKPFTKQYKVSRSSPCTPCQLLLKALRDDHSIVLTPAKVRVISEKASRTGTQACDPGLRCTGCWRSPAGTSWIKFELKIDATSEAGRYTVDMAVRAFTVFASLSRA